MTPLLSQPILLSHTSKVFVFLPELTCAFSYWREEKSPILAIYLFIFVLSREQKQTKAVGFRQNPSRIYVSLEMAALSGGLSQGTNLLLLFARSPCSSTLFKYSSIYIVLSFYLPDIYVKGHLSGHIMFTVTSCSLRRYKRNMKANCVPSFYHFTLKLCLIVHVEMAQKGIDTFLKSIQLLQLWGQPNLPASCVYEGQLSDMAPPLSSTSINVLQLTTNLPNTR